jgi:transposase
MMSRMTAEVLARLIELQGSRTDEEFAALLGVSRSHWAHIRAHRRRLTYAITKRALRVFPELYPIVMQDLAAESVGVVS